MTPGAELSLPSSLFRFRLREGGAFRTLVHMIKEQIPELQKLSIADKFALASSLPTVHSLVVPTRLQRRSLNLTSVPNWTGRQRRTRARHQIYGKTAKATVDPTFRSSVAGAKENGPDLFLALLAKT
jgi:hypothetical protein